MIDLHFHCLPGIDDGPRDWDDAIALCRAAAADGTETIVATPHVLRESWVNDRPEERRDLIRTLNERLGGKPTILPGCEFFFSSDAVDLWQLGSGGPLTALNGSSYLLVEFPATRIPEQAEAVFHEFSILGVRPLIAHPERNLVFSENPERLQRFVELGALAQITAGSLVGLFGRPAQAACQEFFARGLVHIIASDAHSVARRPPQLTAARERVKKAWGLEAETALFDANPAALIADQELPWQ